MNENVKNDYSVLSFFCGCGGLDLGFRGNFDYHGEHYVKLPFDIKAAYDFNGPCVETYNRFFGEHAEKLDLSAADPKDFADTDVLIGGFPCQEFSSCGPLGGLDSDRGQLYKVKSVLSSLAYSQSSSTDLVTYISTNPDTLRSAFKVDEDIYFEKGSSTTLKMSILRRLFALYDLDPMDLVFYLRDAESDKAADEGRYELRKRYWTYALPIIQQAHSHRGSFSNVTPGTSNWCSGYFGVGGFSISCIANYNEAWVALWMSNSDAAKNKRGFDLLYAHKDEIEHEIENYDLSWTRAEEHKASWISYTLKGVSITNESDWPRMAKFHAEWSSKIADAMIPYLSDLGSEADISPEKAEKNKALLQISTLVKEWAASRAEKGMVTIDLDRCNRTYTRFRTPFMDKLIPDTDGTRSGWNSANHYFYEIVNRTGNSAYIQLALSSKEMPQDQLELSDRINAVYPSKYDKPDWQWRTPFRTETISFDDLTDKEEVFARLDESLQSIRIFEEDLQQKLQ